MFNLQKETDDRMLEGRIRPEDEHNRRLVANVHPPDWTNPQPADRYHLVVLGAGTAGLVTAAGAAGLGEGGPCGAPPDGGRLPECGLRALEGYHSFFSGGG